jgi:hypothetical protein
MHPSIEAVKTCVLDVKNHLTKLNGFNLSEDAVADAEFRIHQSLAKLRDVSTDIVVEDLVEFVKDEKNTKVIAQRTAYAGVTLDIINELSNWQSHKIHVACTDKYRYIGNAGDAIVSRIRHLFKECSCTSSESECIGTKLYVKRT